MADVTVNVESVFEKKCERCGFTGPHIRGFYFDEDEQEFRRGIACRACKVFTETRGKVLAN